MSEDNNEKPDCPVGEVECERIDELMAFRAEVAMLEKLVHTDNLTGLFNYRHFELVLAQEFERTRRSGQPTAMIMLDLDFFKKINDEWGHEGGNQVLRQIAGIMIQVLRRIDIPCRYGGEEFVMLLPGTPLPRAVQAAERLRKAIAETPVDFDGKQISVTASMGVSVYMRNSNLDPETFIKQVDKLLYQAKEEGRNCVAHEDLDLFKPKGQVGREEKEFLFGDD